AAGRREGEELGLRPAAPALRHRGKGQRRESGDAHRRQPGGPPHRADGGAAEVREHLVDVLPDGDRALDRSAKAGDVRGPCGAGSVAREMVKGPWGPHPYSSARWVASRQTAISSSIKRAHERSAPSVAFRAGGT